MANHLNALEYAQQMRLEGMPWADEILSALEFEDSPELERLRDSEEELRGLMPEDRKELEPWRMAEWVTGRLALLERIEEHLKDAGLGQKDADDAVFDLILALDL